MIGRLRSLDVIHYPLPKAKLASSGKRRSSFPGPPGSGAAIPGFWCGKVTSRRTAAMPTNAACISRKIWF